MFAPDTYARLLGVLACAIVALGPVAAEPTGPVDLGLLDLNGDVQELSEYRGRYVILNVWASWCAPCRREMPALGRLAKQLEPDAVVLALNSGETLEEVHRFLDQYPVELTVLLDPESTVISAWGLRGLPGTFVIDPKGKIVQRIVGERTWRGREIADLRRLIASSAGD